MRGIETALFVAVAATALGSGAARHLAVLRRLGKARVERAAAYGFALGVLVAAVFALVR